MGVKKTIEGVFVPMVTPFDNDRILYHGLASNIEKSNPSGLAGYFVLGTNGEYKSLSVQERFMVLKTVAAHSAKDKIIMAGMGFESTHETIENILRAADAGVHAVSLLMPHFFAKQMTAPAAQAAYILEVADASPLPILLYNNPSVAANISIGVETIKLVKDHPNVVGVKDSSKEQYKDTLAAAKGSMCVLAGSANYFLDLLDMGGTGGVISLANVYPAECAKLYTLFKTGRRKEAEELNTLLVQLNKQVSGGGGVASVKAAMDMCGLCGGQPRRPLPGLTEEQREALSKIIAGVKFPK